MGKVKEDKIALWNIIDKKRIYNEKENYPKLIVEDIMMAVKPFIKTSLAKEYHKEVEEDIRNQIYAILLKREVNKKWLKH